MTTVAIPTLIPAGTWAIDPSHSAIGFSVRHLGIATVRGAFERFSGSLEAGEQLEQASFAAEIDAASITTSEEQRDAHLRSADFFDVEAHPTISFRSNAVHLRFDVMASSLPEAIKARKKNATDHNQEASAQ